MRNKDAGAAFPCKGGKRLQSEVGVWGLLDVYWGGLCREPSLLPAPFLSLPLGQGVQGSLATCQQPGSIAAGGGTICLCPASTPALSMHPHLPTGAWPQGASMHAKSLWCPLGLEMCSPGDVGMSGCHGFGCRMYWVLHVTTDQGGALKKKTT